MSYEKMNLDDLPPKHRANAERQLREQRNLHITMVNPVVYGMNPDGDVNVQETKKTTIRQKTKQPTKLHRDWGDELRKRYPTRRIREESITLKLCNGVRYTPDWFVNDPRYQSRCLAYECKGFMRDDARKSLLFAAKEFPEIKFVLVWRIKGVWHEQEILA